MINPNEMLFKLNYTLVQVTSWRVVVEIEQLATINEQINKNSRIIYCVSTGTNTPVVRGSIDMSRPTHTNNKTRRHKFVLAIESLQPNTTYTISFYLSTNLVVTKSTSAKTSATETTNYVQLVANRTFTTVSFLRPASLNSTIARASRTNEDDSDEDDGLLLKLLIIKL